MINRVKTNIEFLEGILETKKGIKTFKHNGYLKAQYYTKLSRISENKRSQASMADTKRLAEKYNWQLDELKDHVFTQKKRLEKRGFYLREEAKILLEKIKEHNSILKGKK